MNDGKAHVPAGEPAGGFLSANAIWALIAFLILFYLCVFVVVVRWLPAEQSL